MVEITRRQFNKGLALAGAIPNYLPDFGPATPEAYDAVTALTEAGMKSYIGFYTRYTAMEEVWGESCLSATEVTINKVFSVCEGVVEKKYTPKSPNVLAIADKSWGTRKDMLYAAAQIHTNSLPVEVEGYTDEERAKLYATQMTDAPIDLMPLVEEPAIRQLLDRFRETFPYLALAIENLRVTRDGRTAFHASEQPFISIAPPKRIPSDFMVGLYHEAGHGFGWDIKNYQPYMDIRDFMELQNATLIALHTAAVEFAVSSEEDALTFIGGSPMLPIEGITDDQKKNEELIAKKTKEIEDLERLYRMSNTVPPELSVQQDLDQGETFRRLRIRLNRVLHRVAKGTLLKDDSLFQTSEQIIEAKKLISRMFGLMTHYFVGPYQEEHGGFVSSYRGKNMAGIAKYNIELHPDYVESPGVDTIANLNYLFEHISKAEGNKQVLFVLENIDSLYPRSRAAEMLSVIRSLYVGPAYGLGENIRCILSSTVEPGALQTHLFTSPYLEGKNIYI